MYWKHKKKNLVCSIEKNRKDINDNRNNKNYAKFDDYVTMKAV